MRRFAILALVACGGDPSSSQMAQHVPGHLRVPIVSSAVPALVAVRDDATTTWEPLASRDGGYDVPLAPRFSLLVVCASWMGSEVELRHMTASDPLEFAVACDGFDGESLADIKPRFAPSKVVQTVKAGGTMEACASNLGVCSLREGKRDILVLHGAETPSPRARLVRGVQLYEGAQIEADASMGWRPEPRSIEIDSSIDTGNSAIHVCLETANGDALLCTGRTYHGKFPTLVEHRYLHVPAAHRLPTDCDVLDAPFTRMCLSDVSRTRVEIKPRDVAMRFVDGRLSFALADADALSVDVRSQAMRGSRWHIIATRHWLGDATSYPIPALALPGFRAEWSTGTLPTVTGALIWGPKPSAHRRRSPLWQRLAPGDRIDTRFAQME